MANWEEKRINELGTVARGRSRHRPRDDKSLYGGTYPFIQTGDVKSAEFYLSNFTQTYNEKGLSQSKLWNAGTLCITIAANIAETAILSFDACFPDSIVGFIPFKTVSNVKFVKYSFEMLKKEMKLVSLGATQDNFSVEKMLKFKFIVPDLKTQEKIADILSTYDDLIENNNKRIALLEKASQDLYKEWFVRFRFPGHENSKFENGLPIGWEVKKVSDNFLFKKGKNITKNQVVHGIVPVIAGGLEPSCFHNTANTKGPVITVSASGANAGYVKFNYADIWASDCSYIDNNTDNIYFLYELLSSMRIIISNLQVGSAQPHVYPKDLNRIKIIVPDKNLIEEINPILECFHVKIYNLKIKNENLKRQRDLLLPRLMSGKLEV